ncbi:unnamed protein product [Prorocentrum cordatum]|uniref:Uncharacterized protein n=1 Tax=Prorocentrum cordatum TaxID=2364126 RepID=A0ABN9QH00_9DINO|nr:unnamed protein product [Polarella glacialis]
MPPSGSTSLDMKLCEVQSVELKADAPDYIMKPPGPAVPFLMLLYGSFGFSAHVVARFELQRTTHRWSNFLVYTRVAASLLLGLGRPPRQLLRNLEGLTADIVPERGKPGPYLPPRPSVESQRYLEVGFLNLWSTRGGLVRGVERAGCASRWCCRGTPGGPGRRRAADFGDGVADFYRERGLRTWAKTGTRLQTDRASRGTFRFDAPGGVATRSHQVASLVLVAGLGGSQGVFLQFDGEGRFAFHPGGKAGALPLRLFGRPAVGAADRLHALAM